MNSEKILKTNHFGFVCNVRFCILIIKVHEFAVCLIRPHGEFERDASDILMVHAHIERMKNFGDDPAVGLICQIAQKIVQVMSEIQLT